MEIIKNITQKELTEVIDNPIDQQSRKIKLRNISHENALKNMKKLQTETKVVTKQSEETPKKEKVEWNFVNSNETEYVITGNKPINVKENMLENIKKHSPVMENEQNIVYNEEKIEESKEVPVEVNEIKEEIVENKEDVSKVSNEVQEPNINLTVGEDFDKIKNIRQEVLDKKAEADKVTKEAEESEKTVQELGIQYTEAQKQYEDALKRNKEIKAKVAAALNSQTSTLENAKRKYETLIEEANKKKQANENKIAEFNPKIKNVEEETMNLNNDTAKAEEFLNAIYSNNVIDIPYSYEQEEKVKRVA